MKQKLTKQPLAKSYPILFVYAATNILLETVYLPVYLHLQKNVPGYSANALTNKQILSVGIVVLVIYFAIFGYMVATRNTQKLILILKIVLGIQLVGVLLGLLRLSYLILFNVVQATFTYMVLQKVQNKKATTLF